MKPYTFVDSQATPWRPSTGAAGVQVKDLGSADGRSMQLVRFAPGTTFPVHEHTGPEFVFLLEGEALQEGRRLSPGWASVAAAGSIDTAFHSPDGCLFLTVYSDEVQPQGPASVPSLTTPLDRFYAALKALSAKELAACVTHDFVLDWQGTPSLPWAGTWRGVDGLLSFVKALDASVEILGVQRLHELQDDSVTVVVLRGHWKLKASQREVQATACNLFTFEAGLIKSYTVMNNTAAFAEGLAAS